jgi:hypothetical protein
MWSFPNSVKFEVVGITSWGSQRSGKALQASMDTLCNPLWNSQRGVTSPHLRRPVSDRDHPGLTDEEAPDSAFTEKPEFRQLGNGVVPLECLEARRFLRGFGTGKNI